MRMKAKIQALSHQVEFINSKDKFTALVGGFGCGKSHGGVLRTMHLLERREGK